MLRADRISKQVSYCCPTCGGPLTFDELRVDLKVNTLFAKGVACKVAPRLAELCYVLAGRYPGFVKRQDIISMMWGSQEVSDKLINTTVCHARRNLERVGYGIKNEYGMGYRLVKL